MKKRKAILIPILIASAVHFSGCGEIGEIGTIKNDGESVAVVNTSEPQEIVSESVTAPESLTETETVSAASDALDSSDAPGSTEENETFSESSVRTEGSSEDTYEPDNSPQWIETEEIGELYVNTDHIYSRIIAIQGSERVRQYTLNEKVAVIAKTDTNYYKLKDGTYIHADYLSESGIAYNSENGADYTSLTENGYVIERINGITYVDGIMIANKTYTLPADYDPGVKKEAAEALAEMQNASAAEGLSLYIVSGYRSYYTQKTVYSGWVDRDGTEKADTYSSRAGHSDHQTGYTFDLNSLDQSFADTREGIWLAEHCAEFGFIIRYPKDKEMYTGYVYEPWHVRYIGKEKAKIITESGLSLEEYYGFTSDYDVCGNP